MTATKITIKKAQECHPLAPAVLRQLGGGKDAIQTAIEAGEHGADAGWSGFTYSNDCRDFVRRNKAAIKAMAIEMANDLGDGDVIKLIRGFNCLCTRKNSHTGGVVEYDCTPSEIGSVLYGDGSDAGDVASRIYDALAWFALEEVGRAIANQAEQ